MEMLATDARFYELVDTAQGVNVLQSGFTFIEGPIWNARERHLTFNDIPVSKTYRWSEERGCTLLREDTHKANGNAYDRDGRILVCEHAASRIASTDGDGGDYRVVADRTDGKELNSPNDVIADSRGRIYWSDPNFGRRATRVGVERPQQLAFQSVMLLLPGETNPVVVARDFDQPNGLCLSPDGRIMYVADTPQHVIYCFDVDAAGLLHNQRVFAHTKRELGPGGPDGLKADCDGNIYCAASGGIHVFDAKGTALGVIPVPEQAGNFCFGGDDGKTLFITASTTLYTARVTVAGNRTN